MSVLCNLQSFTMAPLLSQNTQSYFEGEFDLCTIMWKQFINGQGKHPNEYDEYNPLHVCSRGIRDAAK